MNTPRVKEFVSATKVGSSQIPPRYHGYLRPFCFAHRVQTTVNGRTANYSSNSLNQYTQRDVPGTVDITGTANSQATVTVNNSSTQRQSGYFYGHVTVSNSSAPVIVSATTIGVLQSSGTGEDTVSTLTGTTVLPETPEAYEHDADGNLTQDGRWTYTWDAENRLIAMQSLSTIPASVKQKLTFAYDWQGRRIDKSVYYWNTGTSAYVLSKDTRFIYDGWNIIAEVDATNSDSLVRAYLWGQDLSGSLQGAGGIGGLVAITTTGTNGGAYLVSNDANGNVLGLSDSLGNIVATYEYGPFGEVVRASGAMAGVIPFQFSTKYTDSETGLDYYGYRYYNPSTGRWLNRDPIGIRGGINLYDYVLNNPTNMLDRFGLDGTWNFPPPNGGVDDNVTYKMDSQQACCCKVARVQRYYESGTDGNGNDTYTEDGPVGTYNHQTGVANATGDAPEGFGIDFGNGIGYYLSYQKKFKFVAYCERGGVACQGKTLSTRYNTYTSPAHKAGAYSGSWASSTGSAQ